MQTQFASVRTQTKFAGVRENVSHSREDGSHSPAHVEDAHEEVRDDERHNISAIEPMWNLGYRDVDTQSTSEALQHANELGVLGSSWDAEGTPKVAFLFMVLDVVDNEAVWDAFFDRADGSRYSIYVHKARPGSDWDPLSKWGAVKVPTVPSEHCALIGVEVAILSQALADASNAQFVFVSHDAIPVKPFHYTYSQLTANTQRSKICYFTNKRWGGEDQMVLKHHQWVILNRRHSLAFLNNVMPAIDTVYPLQDTYEDGCSDETTISTSLMLAEYMQDYRHDYDAIVAKLHEIGVDEACATWVYWGHERFQGTTLDLTGIANMPSGRPPMSFAGEPSVKAHYLERLVTREGFMFARKFYNGALVDHGDHQAPLVEVLPSLWDNVDEGMASSRVWSRLDAFGAPQAW